MKRHQRRFADAENAQAQQHSQLAGFELVGQEAAHREVGGTRDVPDEDQGRQQENGGRAQQQTEVNTPAVARLFSAGVGDQRVGAERQHFVEDEQGKQVARKSNAHGGGN